MRPSVRPTDDTGAELRLTSASPDRRHMDASRCSLVQMRRQTERPPVLRVESRCGGQPRPEIRRWIHIQIGSQGEPLRFDPNTGRISQQAGGARSRTCAPRPPRRARQLRAPRRRCRVRADGLARAGSWASPWLFVLPVCGIRRCWPCGTTASFAPRIASARAVTFYDHGIARLEDRWHGIGSNGRRDS